MVWTYNTVHTAVYMHTHDTHMHDTCAITYSFMMPMHCLILYLCGIVLVENKLDN